MIQQIESGETDGIGVERLKTPAAIDPIGGR
jgi:hypothetical protein